MAVIGIDLGTTNSLASVWKDGTCILIPNRFQEYLTPSVVSFDEDGMFYTGKIAKERLISHPGQTVSLFKRTMGTETTYDILGKTYTSEELSSFLIRQLIDDAQDYLMEPIEEAIISVPAYFNDEQRCATKRAGKLAGVKVERLINEPSAAALYARKHKEDATFLVFDFGGGTLDISIVECFQNIISILAVSGDTHLGGSDFDKCIAEAFCEEHHITYETLDAANRSILLRQCEECKIALSKQEEVTRTFQLMQKEYTFTLSNQGLIRISADLLERILIPIRKAMQDSDISEEELSRIILVGGSSKMPIIRTFLQHTFPIDVTNADAPDTIVASGIGVYTGIKERSDDIKDIILSDICPFTLGIAIHNPNDPDNSLMHAIIERNSILPSSKEHSFYTVHDYQTVVTIRIFQGESMYCKKNLALASKEIHVKPAKTGEYPIHVRFTYDINGILDVDILDTSSSHIEKITVAGNHNTMSEEEIAERLHELQSLKIHPREQEKNKLLLAKIERLFEETTKEEREHLMRLNMQFEAVLAKQDIYKIEKERIRIMRIVEAIELRLHPEILSWS